MNHFRQQVAKFQARLSRQVSERAAAIGSKLSKPRGEWLLRHPQYPDIYIQCNDLEEAGRKLAMWERRIAA